MVECCNLFIWFPFVIPIYSTDKPDIVWILNMYMGQLNRSLDNICIVRLIHY